MSQYRPLALWSALILGAGLLAGCNRVGSWDHEYNCQGQEQTHGQFVAPAEGPESHSEYPLGIDFHIRGAQVLIKTYAAPIEDPSAERLVFSIKGPMVWLQGAFEQSTQVLTVVEERLLDTPLGRQSTRTTGRFQCKAAT
jgi:hypothetical protein